MFEWTLILNLLFFFLAITQSFLQLFRKFNRYTYYIETQCIFSKHAFSTYFQTFWKIWHTENRQKEIFATCISFYLLLFIDVIWHSNQSFSLILNLDWFCRSKLILFLPWQSKKQQFNPKHQKANVLTRTRSG